MQGVEAAEIDVALRDSERPREELLAELRQSFAGLPGTNVAIGQPISHRIDHMLSGTRANIAVKIVGDDLVTLRRIGERVQEAMGGVEGVVDLTLEPQTEIPFIRFVLNRAAVARYGLRAQDVAEAIETSFAGTTVGRIFDRATAFDLVVKLDAASAVDFQRIADLPVDTPLGQSVPIRVLADVRREMGPNMILRENVQRRIVVSANVSGRDLGSVVEDIQAAVAAQVLMPDGYRVEYGGQFESQESATETLLVLGAAAIAGVFMMLVLAFGRVRDALLVMLNLPLRSSARSGRLPGGWCPECRLDYRVHHAVRHRDPQRHHAGLAHPSPGAGGGRDEPPRRGGAGGARAAGADPDDRHGGRPRVGSVGAARRRGGSEIQTPMAIVILCGLTTSTLLNMFVVPTLYLKYGRAAARTDAVAIETP